MMSVYDKCVCVYACALKLVCTTADYEFTNHDYELYAGIFLS